MEETVIDLKKVIAFQGTENIRKQVNIFCAINGMTKKEFYRQAILDRIKKENA